MNNKAKLIPTVLLTMVALVSTPPVAAADDPFEIEVSGYGEVERDPDEVVVSIGVIQRDPSTVEAQSRVNGAINATVAAIRELEIDGIRIETTRVTLWAEYEEIEKDGKTKRGALIEYRAEREILIRLTDLSAVGRVIDHSIQNGVNYLDRADFILSDPTPDELEALRIATNDAKLRAETIADSLGMTLGPVLEVDNVGSGTTGGGQSPFTSVGENTRTEIDPSPITVDASVRIKWQLLEK